jgi:hypothetical protein
MDSNRGYGVRHTIVAMESERARNEWNRATLFSAGQIHPMSELWQL